MSAAILTLRDAGWDILAAVTGVNHYDGEVTDPPLDDDGRVHAYTVYYPGPGHERSLLACGGGDTTTWTFQVTVVGGDTTRCLWAVGKVRDAFKDARIGGELVTEIGDPGPVRRDDDVTPSRLYVPLDFTVTS